jgi:glycosyltransferase involved in cell wall biosynthesis
VPDLLEAARRARVPVDLVGGSGEEPAEAHQQMLATGRQMVEEGLAVFHGEVPRAKVQELLETTSVFVLPSHAEGLPVSLLEAMERGVPVVVTDVGGMGMVVRAARCGIVVPVADVDALAAAIGRIVADPELGRQMGASGRQAIVQEYDRLAVGTTLMTLYRAVACLT